MRVGGLVLVSLAAASAVKFDAQTSASLIQQQAEEHMRQVQAEQEQIHQSWQKGITQQSLLQYNATETIAAQLESMKLNAVPWNPHLEEDRKAEFMKEQETADPAAATAYKQEEMQRKQQEDILARESEFAANAKQIIEGTDAGNNFAPWDPRGFNMREAARLTKLSAEDKEDATQEAAAAAPAAAPAAEELMFVAAAPAPVGAELVEVSSSEANIHASLLQYSGGSPRNPDEVVEYQAQQQTQRQPWYPGIEEDQAKAKYDEESLNPAIATIREAESNLKALKLQLEEMHPIEDYPALHYDADHPWTEPVVSEE